MKQKFALNMTMVLNLQVCRVIHTNNNMRFNPLTGAKIDIFGVSPLASLILSELREPITSHVSMFWRKYSQSEPDSLANRSPCPPLTRCFCLISTMCIYFHCKQQLQGWCWCQLTQLTSRGLKLQQVSHTPGQHVSTSRCCLLLGVRAVEE